MPLVPKGVLGTAIYAGTDYKDEPAILTYKKLTVELGEMYR